MGARACRSRLRFEHVASDGKSRRMTMECAYAAGHEGRVACVFFPACDGKPPFQVSVEAGIVTLTAEGL